jgi:hypothetical protein
MAPDKRVLLLVVVTGILSNGKFKRKRRAEKVIQYGEELELKRRGILP